MKDSRTPASRWWDALQQIRAVDPEMPAQTLAALIYIHRNPGTNQTSLREALGVETSTVARIAARLSDRHTPRRKGLGLIVNEMNPADNRERQLYLTPKGQRFIGSLEALFN